ncbi:GCR1-dependent translation factor 1 [Collariella sp. IMI 366227]|nr:GCR1-dependent translation factor 1 [Collariella sp. IMI 366227]
MRLRNRKSPLLLLLLPSLAVATALADPQPNKNSAAIVEGAASRRYSTKDAPVDGKDGKPHEGPFVELNKNSESARDLPALKDRPEDPLVVDGKRVPDRHDGVMDDKNRQGPKKGTTGIEGGVSEKSKDRELKEKETGSKVENKPPTPKEAPPLPHSAQEKGSAGTAGKSAGKTVDDALGLEKPADLPDKTHDKSPPIPDSVANKDYLDVSKGSKPGKSTGPENEGGEGLIQPFHSFMLSFTMIIFSEIGDKTFLVAALMAMKHDRLVVFSAAFCALITMTVLSAVLGHAVPTLIPKRLTTLAAALLFLVFGARLLREGLAMSPDEGVSAEMQEVEMELEEKENLARKEGRAGAGVSPYALEMGLARPRAAARRPGAARSWGSLAGLNNLVSLLLSPAWVQTFVMTFLGEWGDRSQIATIAMAAGQDYWWVTLGAVLGHGCCTGVAVIGGRAIAGKVSLRVVTVGGAVAFLFFGLIYLFEAYYA